MIQPKYALKTEEFKIGLMNVQSCSYTNRIETGVSIHAMTATTVSAALATLKMKENLAGTQTAKLYYRR